MDFGVNIRFFLLALAAIVVGSFLIGAISRFIFGKRSVLVGALSSATGILFVYALNIVLHSLGADFYRYTTPLPFITVGSDEMTVFSFSGADFSVICEELVSMILLAFIMNLIDRIIPKGKSFFVWILLRIATVVLAQAGHLLISMLSAAYLPEGILFYAPMILFGLLVLLLLTGCLKYIVGLFLTTVNPIIAGLYTFFFANVVGKMITKAVLTTAILSGLVYLLEVIGIASISIALEALIVYVPLLILLMLLWHFILKLFH